MGGKKRRQQIYSIRKEKTDCLNLQKGADPRHSSFFLVPLTLFLINLTDTAACHQGKRQFG